MHCVIQRKHDILSVHDGTHAIHTANIHKGCKPLISLTQLVKHALNVPRSYARQSPTQTLSNPDLTLLQMAVRKSLYTAVVANCHNPCVQPVLAPYTRYYARDLDPRCGSL